MFKKKYWKYITFSVPIEREVTKTDKNGNKFRKNQISYRQQFIDSVRFMTISSSILVYNVSKEIHEIKCKCIHDNKKCENCGNKYKVCNFFLDNGKFKHALVEYKSLCCDKNYKKSS